MALGASIGALSGDDFDGVPDGGAAARTGGGAGRSTAVTAYRSGRAGSGNSPGATSGPITTAAMTATCVATEIGNSEARRRTGVEGRSDRNSSAGMTHPPGARSARPHARRFGALSRQQLLER
jgi:hypothetical protein